MTLERFLTVTAGFTPLTVRIGMVRALAALGFGNAGASPLGATGYRRFYRTVLEWLP